MKSLDGISAKPRFIATRANKTLNVFDHLFITFILILGLWILLNVAPWEFVWNAECVLAVILGLYLVWRG